MTVFKKSFMGLIVLGLFIGSLSLPGQASALSGSDFNSGRIIDDTIFFNPNLLGGPNEIQAFLNSKVPICDTYHAAYGDNNPPFTCLKDYRQDTPAKSAENGLCGQYSGGNRSAAEIIYYVGQACNVSPGVLIVLLQKEQSLITDTWPLPIQYRSATGYGCPDTAACDSDYFGFFNQVYSAARQFRKYGRDASLFRYRSGRDNYIQYNPNSNCGGSNIYIQNQATAGLYNYTPYQPNQPALANLYGQGDGCSAYGNRNFWRLFSEWFGSTQTSARVIVDVLDGSTDKSGDAARVGFRLNQRPSSSVTIPVALSSTAYAGFASKSLVTISPENWNNSQANQVVIYGKNSTTNGSDYYSLVSFTPQTDDSQFKLLTGEFIADVPLSNNQEISSSIYRLIQNSTGRHIYTANPSERDQLKANGFSDEGLAFYACASGEVSMARLRQSGTTKTMMVQVGSAEYNYLLQSGYEYEISPFAVSSAGTVPIYRLYGQSNNDHFYTQSPNERDYAISQGMKYEGLVYNTCSQNKKPVFRLRNSVTGTYFYTTSPAERDSAGVSGFNQEGVALYNDQTANVPVYRFFNRNHGGHFYTTNPSEVNPQSGYTNEGIGFYSNPQATDTMPVYRLVNPATGAHLYTLYGTERDNAVKYYGYTSEGIAYYTKR